MPTVTVAAPAKVNLYLEILGQRDDGFHELETIFQTITLADVITVSCAPGSGIDLTVRGAELPTGPDNLAWRAADAYLHRHPLGHVSIQLTKCIPHGAGLGGGSSDAAAVLRALARCDDAPLRAEELHELAAGLGSDVPFFLIGGTAWAGGRGEQLIPLPDAPEHAVTLLMPPAHLPTPTVYRALTTPERGPRAARGADFFRSALRSDVSSLLHNRLTAAARRCESHVDSLLNALASTGVPHLLSGSGAACFALGQISALPGVTTLATRFRARCDLDRTD